MLRYAGDSVLAVFGGDESREDDPELAVRAGLKLLAEAAGVAEQVRSTHRRETFGIRVGIHSGPVLLGGGLEAEAEISGITVHVAVRMEQTAPAGGLRISHDTYTQVRGLFEFEPGADAELRRSHDERQALAGRLTDPEHRQRLLGAVPVHRAIVEAYDAFRLRA